MGSFAEPDDLLPSFSGYWIPVAKAQIMVCILTCITNDIGIWSDDSDKFSVSSTGCNLDCMFI